MNYTTACIDKHDVIHVTWLESVDNVNKCRYVQLSKNSNGYLVWSNAIEVGKYNGGNQPPSICIDKNNRIFLLLASVFYIRYSLDYGKTWISFGDPYPRPTYSDSWSFLQDNNLEIEFPLGIYKMKSTASNNPDSIVFSGKWYE